MKKWIKEFNVYLGILGSSLTLISFNNEYKISPLLKELKKSNNILDLLKEKEKLVEDMDKQNFQELRKTIEYHINKLKDQNNNNNIVDYHVRELNISFTNIKNNLNNLFSFFDPENNKENFIGDNGIFDSFKYFLDQWNEMLSGLTIIELGALSHLLIGITILILLFNIIFIIYSDFFIKYFQLEEKYPRLGILLKIRRKFNNFYIVVNFILIIYLLLLVIYVNYSIFFS